MADDKIPASIARPVSPTAAPVATAPGPAFSEVGMDPMALAVEAPLTAVTSGLSAAIPFYKYLLAKGVGAVTGQPDQSIAADIAKEENQFPGASALGTVGGVATAVATHPGMAGVGPATRILTAGAEGAAYGAGNLSASDQLTGSPLVDITPLGIEKYMHQVGLPTLLSLGLGTAGEGVGALAGLVSKVAKGAAVTTARKAMGLPFDAEELAQKALDRNLLNREGAFAARADKARIGGQISDAVAAIPGTPHEPAAITTDAEGGVVSAVAPKLRATTAQLESVPGADGAKAYVQKGADRLESADTTWSDVHELQKDLASRARTSKNVSAKKIYADATKALSDHIAEQAPEVPTLASKYKEAVGLARGAAKAANEVPEANLLGIKIPIPTFLNKGTRAKAYDRVAKVASGFETAVQDGAGALFSAGAAASVNKGVSAKDYDKIRDTVNQCLADPQAFQRRLHDNLRGLPPEAAGAVQARTTAALDFMHMVAPKNPHQPLPGALPWEPNMQQKLQYTDTWNALTDPASVLQNPTPAGMAAIKHVYPESLAHVTREVSSRLAESQDLPHDVKNRVSRVLGMPMDAIQQPSFGARNQARLQAYRQSKQEAGQSGSARTKASTRKADKAAVTRAQRIQSDQEQF